MIQLKQITYKDIEKYDNDYCSRSKDPEVPERCSWYGVYMDNLLVSYFALRECENDGIFIRRGYVLPEYRSKGIWQTSMTLLEQAVKSKGYRNIRFESYRNPIAYLRLFKNTGFKPDYAGFVKHLGD